MSPNLIQWSNHARSSNGTGNTRDQKGDPMSSLCGYVTQAWHIASTSPQDMARTWHPSDLDKAKRILIAGKMYSLAAQCVLPAET